MPGKELNLNNKISLRELIYFSLRLYIRYFRSIFKNLVLFFIPVIIVFAALGLPLYSRLTVFFFNIASDEYSVYGALTAQMGHEVQVYTVLFTLLVHLICVFAQGAVILGFHSIALETPEDSRTDPLTGILRRIIPLMGTNILGLVLVVFTGLLTFWILCIPMGILLLMMVFVTPCVLIEDNYYFTAVKRSFNLAKTRFWQIAGFIIFMGSIGGIIRFLTGLPLIWIPYSPELTKIIIRGNSFTPDIALVKGLTTGYFMSMFLNYLFMFFFSYPVTAIGTALLYYNYRNLSSGPEKPYRIAV